MIRGDRIKLLLEESGGSQADLARAIGVSPQAVSKLVGGGTQESPKIFQIARFLKTTPEYLQGETDDRSLASAGAIIFDEDNDDVEIDSIDLAYGMGGTFVDDEGIEVEKAKFSRSWLRQFTAAPPQQLVSTQGVGDSMWPTIHDRDVVIVDKSTRTVDQGDKIWAIVFGGVGMIKRLRPLPDGTVRIMSDNQQVRDELATDGDLFVVGRVAAIVRRV